MPQPLRDHLERLASGQRGSRVAVADAMQGDRRQAGIPHQPREALGDVLGVQDLAVLAGWGLAWFRFNRGELAAATPASAGSTSCCSLTNSFQTVTRSGLAGRSDFTGTPMPRS